MNPYGRVWHPSVINTWQPFTNGHWTYDGTDWVWVSYEPFGWIVYHYGNWENTPEYGWLWLPARDAWSPARVQWIDYGDNIGWAPMRANNRSWGEPWENNNVHPWMVVRMEDFNRDNITSYGVSAATRNNHIGTSSIQRNAPQLRTIQSHVKDPIKIVKINKEPNRNENQAVRNNPLPIKTEATPREYPKVVPQVRNDDPAVRTNILPVRNDNPTVRENTPPVRTEAPPVNTKNATNVRAPNNRNIIHMQVPPEEKQRVDRYSPKVQKDMLIKKNPRPNVKPLPKQEEKQTNDRKKE